jgi:hypothetical protein
MPESLACARAMDFLTEKEQRTLNQIRGLGYLVMFGLVEEYILPFVIDHARPRLAGDDIRTRALLQFASEEAKHIQLFKLFRQEFDAGFPTRCEVIGPPEAVAAKVLSHSELAVALLTLHIEWFVQRHYLESIRDDQALDPQFKSLLKHHWIEEAQHAKLDALLVQDLARRCTPGEIDRAIDEYFEIGALFDAGFKQQASLDLDAFERTTDRSLTPEERTQFLDLQHQALRWTFLGSAMSNRNFLVALAPLGETARARIGNAGAAFC